MDSKNCTRCDAQRAEHEVPSCFCDLTFGNLDGSKHIYILLQAEKTPAKVCLKNDGPKKNILEMANLHL